MKILITGGAGFIGSNFVHHMFEKYPDYKITVLDRLSYAGNLNNLKDVIEQIEFVKGDICDKKIVERLIKGCDFVVNFAAMTHVDRSIIEAGSFVQTDVFGTYRLLEACKKFNVERFIQISSDEIYGHILQGSFKEEDKLNPRNPYAASKAGADLLCKAYFETYGLPVILTRSTNNYGPHQHPEKFIAKCIIYALLNKKIPVYGAGKNVRDWLYVEDNCEAIDLVLQKGIAGEIYNIAGKQELENIEVVRKILRLLRKRESSIEFVKDRPGHDLRYSLDISKIKKLGWKPKTKFEEGIRKTVEWYKQNEWWWKPIIEKEQIDFHGKFK